MMTVRPSPYRASHVQLVLSAGALATSLAYATATRADEWTTLSVDATQLQARYVLPVFGKPHDYTLPDVGRDWLLQMDVWESSAPQAIDFALALQHVANPHVGELSGAEVQLAQTLKPGTQALPANATSLVPPNFVSVLHIQFDGSHHYDHVVVTGMGKVLGENPARITSLMLDVSAHHWPHEAEASFTNSSVISLPDRRRPRFGAVYLFDAQDSAMTLKVIVSDLVASEVVAAAIMRCSDGALILELSASDFSDNFPSYSGIAFTTAQFSNLAFRPAHLALLRNGEACLKVGTSAGSMVASLPAPIAIPVTRSSMPLYGAESLRAPVTHALDECSAEGLLMTDSLSYLSSTSSATGKAMTAGDYGTTPFILPRHQQIAPQARFLSPAECDFFAPSRGQGLSIGLDSIALLADHSEPHNQCDTLRSTGTLSGYAFSDWRDVLRVLYTGQTSKVSSDPCSASEPARTPSNPGNITGRCDGPVRRALVENWSNLFEGGCTNVGCPNGLRHAFRTDDSSDTTEAFLTLLGLPASNTRTFCNGFDIEDLDPIRRPCAPNEQVCSNIPYANRMANANGGLPSAGATNPTAAGGDLGLVLAVTMPEASSIQYGAPCSLGAFAYAPMPYAAYMEAQRCPDGNQRAIGRCRWPLTTDRKFGCRAVITTRPPVRTFSNMDGRAYNWMPRHPDTGGLLNTKNVSDPRWGGGGLYRLHQTASTAGGSSTCSQADSTSQIGCLINADPCSIGYASRRALAWDGTSYGSKALSLRSPIEPGVSVAPSDANIALQLDPSGNQNGTCSNGPGDNFGLRYPLVQHLYVNASAGFGGDLETFPGIADITAHGVLSNENQLLRCIADRGNGILDGALREAGYVTLPGSVYPVKACP